MVVWNYHKIAPWCIWVCFSMSYVVISPARFVWSTSVYLLCSKVVYLFESYGWIPLWFIGLLVLKCDKISLDWAPYISLCCVIYLLYNVLMMNRSKSEYKVAWFKSIALVNKRCIHSKSCIGRSPFSFLSVQAPWRNSVVHLHIIIRMLPIEHEHEGFKQLATITGSA